jgi:hypothetical protein
MRTFSALLLFGLAAGCSEYNTRSASIDPPGTVWTGTAPPTQGQVPLGWGNDSWDLPSNPTVDVIFYGDTSDSMTQELLTMGQNVTRFLDRLADNVPDWQLGVITGNTGCAVNGILTPDMPDAPAKFADAIITKPADTVEDEMGLQNVAIGVEKSVPGKCNEGLVRGDTLHLVFVSDENDESPGFAQSEDYWTRYLDRITAVHGTPELVYVSAVAGPVPDGCNGADPGWGYAEAVEGTDGELLSICANWPEQLGLLADVGTTLDVFELTEVPVVDSLIVYVNSAEVPGADWKYDQSRNAVVFVQNKPSPGDNVDIVYDVAE